MLALKSVSTEDNVPTIALVSGADAIVRRIAIQCCDSDVVTGVMQPTALFTINRGASGQQCHAAAAVTSSTRGYVSPCPGMSVVVNNAPLLALAL